MRRAGWGAEVLPSTGDVALGHPLLSAVYLETELVNLLTWLLGTTRTFDVEL